MVGLDLFGVDKDKLPKVGAGLGALVGLFVLAYTGKHAGGRWFGRSHLLGHSVHAVTRNSAGAVVGAVAGAAVGMGVKAVV